MSRARAGRLCCALFVVALFVSTAATAQSVMTEILETGVLSGGIVDADNYPFVYESNGVWNGYELELMRQLADQLGVTLEIEIFPDRSSLIAAIRDREIHIAFSKVFDDMRNAEIAFQTSPVAELGLSVVVNRRAYAALRTKGDLSSDLRRGRLAVATVAEQSFVRSIVSSYPGSVPETVSSLTSLWESVESGERIAIALDDASVYRYFAQNPRRGIELRTLPLAVSSNVVGLVPWQDDFFWGWVNILVENQGDPARLEEFTIEYPAQ